MEQCQLIKLARLGNRDAAKRLTDEAVDMMLERMREIWTSE